MTISKVIALFPTEGEEPFNSNYGLLYPFTVTFADGTSGKVNAKSDKGPAYKVGDMVGYEITGKHGGVNKIKVDKKAAQGAGQQTAPQPPQTANPRAPEAPKASQTTSRLPRDPAAIGMSLKLAGDILMHNARVKAEPVILDRLPGDLWEVASLILEAGAGLASYTKPANEPF